ncbi:imelysin family protein [Reinekea blandensis]|uniref:Putative iron-regulated protein A n=1 Tax=Reinekea blandensis MED297 TaxID=314283 RepID=A4BG12_9GAMM|nr:imelysin family protein [Reinekea blandensis]EAR09030.1 putative iron-regulated protein A [Reinekea sp. MED297] [Reinekea blandensis MED297]
MKHLIAVTLLAAGVAHAEITSQDVVEGYTDIAYTNYADALQTAEALQSTIENLVDHPSAEALAAAKAAWLEARPSYQQSEVFRFGNAVVDDWEGQLNAWPLDEGLIDYVDDRAYEFELGNDGGTANLVANKRVGDLKVSRLKPETLASLNEFGGSEANVATGYHAIEFLLWGQDLNGHQAGAGERPWTDYAKGNDCTNENCKRRGQYLEAAAELLVEDLEYMVAQWAPDGDYRQQLLQEDEQTVLNKMLFGMGSLALGELAGERIKVALTANSTEDEHDCFSDNTHNSHYYNAKGVANLYFGSYTNADGETTRVVGLRDLLLVNGHADLIADADRAFAATQQSMAAMVTRAENGEAFDQMIAPGNTSGAALLNDAINRLVEETAAIESMALALGIEQLTPDDAGHAF